MKKELEELDKLIKIFEKYGYTPSGEALDMIRQTKNPEETAEGTINFKIINYQKVISGGDVAQYLASRASINSAQLRKDLEELNKNKKE